MVTHDPIPIQLKPDAPLFDKLRMLLGHYDLRVYLRDQAYIDVGRGSFDACFSTEPRVEDFAGCVPVLAAGQASRAVQPLAMPWWCRRVPTSWPGSRSGMGR